MSMPRTPIRDAASGTPRIFISYRRADSREVTGRIYDRLVQRFGASSVFRDIDSIPLGVPFPTILQETLTRTDVVLVIIGPSWLTVTDNAGRRRVDDPDDMVRMEVETALRQAIPVIPVLVSNARYPARSDLPTSIRDLGLRNGVPARPDPDFHTDVDRLIGNIELLLDLPPDPGGPVTVKARVSQLELQNELQRIDREWEVERQGHLIYSKNSAPSEPTMLLPIGALLGGILLIAFCVISMNDPASGDPGKFAVSIVVYAVMAGIAGLISTIKYVEFRDARKRYLERRAAVLKGFPKHIEPDKSGH